MRNVLAALLLLAAAGAAALYGAAVFLVQTPAAARKAAELLSRTCGQPVLIERLRLRGATLCAEGIVIPAVPPDTRPLLTLRSLQMTPSAPALFSGRTALSTLRLRGIDLDVHRRGNDWNFSPLQQRLAARKSGGETTIGTLSLEDASLTIEGRSFAGISFTLRDFSTRSPASAGLNLTFSDGKGHPVWVSGGGKPGGDSLAITLATDSFDLEALSPRLSGTLRLAATANLEKQRGTARIEGDVAARVPVGGERIPARIAFGGTVTADVAKEIATVSDLRVSLDDALLLRGNARIERLRSERQFRASINADCADVAPIIATLPAALRHGLTGDGRLHATGTVAGDLRGISWGDLTLSLADGNFRKNGVPVARGGNVTLRLQRTPSGWSGSGNAALAAGPGIVGKTTADIALLLSPEFRLREAALPAFTAVAAGLPVSGSLTYRSSDPAPIGGAIHGSRLSLADAARFLPPSVRISRGTGSLDLRFSGTPAELTGSWSATASGARIQTKGKQLLLDRAAFTGSFRGLRHPAVTGTGEVSGSVDDRPVSISAPFTATPGTLRLGTTRFSSGELSGALSAAEIDIRKKDHGIEAAVALHGIEAQGRGIRVAGGQGKFRGVLGAPASGGGTTGEGEFSAAALTWRAATVSGISARASLASRKLAGSFSSAPLGGTCSGTVSATLAGPAPEVGFRTVFSGIRADRVAAVAGQLPVTVTEGTIDGTVTGSYRRDMGLSCSFSTNGSGLSVTRGMRTASGIGFSGRGSVTGGSLALDGVSVSLPPGTVFRAQGNIAAIATKERHGSLLLSLEPTPLGTILASTPGGLPAPLRDCEGSGTLDVTARVAVRGNRATIDGDAALQEATLRAPSQKLAFTRIAGKVPFSLAFGGEPVKTRSGGNYSREEFAAGLTELRSRETGDPDLTVGGISFGAFEATNTRLFFRAGEGVTRLRLLEADLLGGKLLGEGYLYRDKRLVFGADLLVEGASLRKLCAALPTIKGYLSGKTDGVVSVQGKNPGVEGLVGLLSFWTRETGDEKKLVSREFLQKLAGKKLNKFFFRDDRPFDTGEISALLDKGYLTFTTLDLSHTNLFGVRDLSVTVVPVQNRIGLVHLLHSIREAAARGKKVGKTGDGAPDAPPAAAPQTEFKWLD